MFSGFNYFDKSLHLDGCYFLQLQNCCHEMKYSMCALAKNSQEINYLYPLMLPNLTLTLF